MIYEAVYTDHVIHLTDEETDRFFDPFDPMNQDMPFFLHNARHRYIKEDIYEWLIASIGEAGYEWSHIHGLTKDCRSFKFKQQDHAMLFKLTYGGK